VPHVSLVRGLPYLDKLLCFRLVELAVAENFLVQCKAINSSQ
jgi:hypothetical protein